MAVDSLLQRAAALRCGWPWLSSEICQACRRRNLRLLSGDCERVVEAILCRQQDPRRHVVSIAGSTEILLQEGAGSAL